MRYDSYDKNDILESVHLNLFFSVSRFLANTIHFVIFVIVMILSIPFLGKKDEKKLNSREISGSVLNCPHDKITSPMIKPAGPMTKSRSFHDKIHGPFPNEEP
jgi:hypothetical protein